MSECDSSSALGESAAPAAFFAEAAGEAGEPDITLLMNRLDCGVVVLRPNAEVVAINPAALKLVGDALLFAQQRIHASTRHFQDQFETLLRKAAFRATDENACMCLPSPSGRRPLLLRFMPLDGGGLEDVKTEPVVPPKRERPSLAQKMMLDRMRAKPAAVLLLIHDLEYRQNPSCGAALRALGLTPAETAVAEIVGAGLSPVEASDRLGISVLTVRTHLKAIFQKLGLQRQGELVRIVSHLSLLA